ncbi:MAG: hypothetical protein GX628_01800 [Clostridiales bacterium]|nr:hypothetical protein [Clostridiales bacterium]
MKEKTALKPTVFFAAAACITAVTASVFQYYLMYNNYYISDCLYAPGTVVPAVYHWLLFAVMVILGLSFFTADRERKELPPDNTAFIFISSMTAFMFVAQAIIYFVRSFSSGADKWLTASALLAVPAAVYFFFIVFGKPQSQNPRIVFGFFVIIWSAVTLLATHFDKTTPLNSPLRIQHQISLIFIMMFMLFELRYLLGIAMPRFYTAIACMVIPLTIIPAVCSAAFELMGYPVNPFGLFTYASEFCVGLFAAVRLLSGCLPQKTITEPEPTTNEVLQSDTDTPPNSSDNALTSEKQKTYR